MHQLPVSLELSDQNLPSTSMEQKLLTQNLSVRKRRCMPTNSPGLCQLCKQLSVPCSLATKSSETQQILASHSSKGSDVLNDDVEAANPPISLLSSNHTQRSSLIPAKTLLYQLVDLYFRLIHNTPHTLFHESTFLSELDSGSVPQFILLGMIALSAR